MSALQFLFSAFDTSILLVILGLVINLYKNCTVHRHVIERLTVKIGAADTESDADPVAKAVAYIFSRT